MPPPDTHTQTDGQVANIMPPAPVRLAREYNKTVHVISYKIHQHENIFFTFLVI